ncbi:MAG: PilZ domain-containing protein [Vicinamibacterales bacterium]
MNTDDTGFEARIGIALAERRESDRVTGPFDAWRLDVLDTPVRLFDMSDGGCFVNAMHEQEPGVLVALKIHVPDDGWLELQGETLHRRPGFGFSVRFVNVTDEQRRRLARALEGLRQRRSR